MRQRIRIRRLVFEKPQEICALRAATPTRRTGPGGRRTFVYGSASLLPPRPRCAGRASTSLACSANAFGRHLAIEAQAEDVEVRMQPRERILDQIVLAAAGYAGVQLRVVIGELAVARHGSRSRPAACVWRARGAPRFPSDPCVPPRIWRQKARAAAGSPTADRSADA